MAGALRVPVAGLSAGQVTLSEDASHYVLRVHRLEPGALLVVFDPELGAEAEAELVGTHERRAVCRVTQVRAAAGAALQVTLFQGLGKGDKLDQVVRDTTALGVARIVGVETARSVVKLAAADRRESRRARWRKIAVEAARQSGRADVPEIVGPLSLAEALTAHAAPATRRWYFEPSAQETLANALPSWDARTPTCLIIGPEGGLSPDEIEVLRGAGFTGIRLGPHTLRTETAATVVLGALFVASQRQ